MEFNINNVCKVNKADITANGITVIAGYNDTGKSTILKSIDVFLKTFGKKQENIESERWNSIFQLLVQKQELLNQINPQVGLGRSVYVLCEELNKNRCVDAIEYSYFKDVYLKVIREYLQYGESSIDEKKLCSDSFIKELYDGIDEIKRRPLKNYWGYHTLMDLRSEFSGALVNLINHKASMISSGNHRERKIVFEGNSLHVEGDGIPSGNIIYMETRNLLDDLGTRSRQPFDSLRRYLYKEPKIEALEQYDTLEQNKKTLNEIFKVVLHGKLMKDDDVIKYHDDQIDELINLRNVASGMKSLLIIQRLVENGSLTSGSWLMIDEPETNLHPEWHIKMAEILVLMKKEMNINVIVSSHSAYFIRALEVKLASNQMLESGKFYLMEKNGKMFDAVDVSKNTERIYKQLYKPLEEL